MAKVLAEMAGGLYVDPQKLTVGEYLDNHWLPALPATIRPTTADTYRRLVRLHIVPTLGSVPLQKLQRAHVARWLAELTAGGLAAKSVRNVHGVLSKALADAVELELVNRNVASRPRTLPAAIRPTPRVWTVEQAGAFLAGTANDRFAPLWRFFATTGCRRGEALGLRWVDVDLDESTVTITRQRTIAGGSVVEGAPKTGAGARSIAIDPATTTSLRSWRAAQAAERLQMGWGWADTGLVFTHPDGTGLWPQMITRRFGELSGQLGLPAIGVHGLRHSVATYLIARGVNPRVVQQRLGHAQVAVTLGLYTHVLPGHDREAAASMADAVDGLS
jgi:integrase